MIRFCLAIILPLFAVSTGFAGIPVLEGEYSLAYQGEEVLTLMVLPDGGGPSFDEAFLPAGSREDATITLTIWDAVSTPIANFPSEDMWLESWDGGLVSCPGGTIADSNTDAAGTTTWSTPPYAGGHSLARTEVLVNGSILDYAPGLKLNFNSPDINGDLTVNLSDVQIFTTDFYGDYNFRSDFRRDGIVNLSDLPYLAQAVGANCP